ncbi:glycoside hydrolase family 78 protein [Paenibacillus sp. J5C_2022]|uniref:glycoside hydrolase family 78 protein n=1 Tax=Paenibacillus sp. J5C2022 TaxID=2977129 RepID=UPI0021CF414A|nr:glycoside hydrolase family 78 protein [Paenibacillus sp. J5C2022]MCU6710238.1 glycoside hydrolase family 78 protein [Paenibacillus sp. J5C2022]
MDKRWTAKWITDEDFGNVSPLDMFHKEKELTHPIEHREDLKNRHMLARKEFEIDGPFSDAILDITADDYYKLYINNRFVGQGPAQGNYFHYYYNRYSIAPYLRQGRNVIAVHVYYMGLINRAYNSGDYRQGLIAELALDGKVIEATDRTWKYTETREYGTGEVIGYNTQYLENVNHLCKQEGWRVAGYNDSDWKPVLEHRADDHKLFLQPTPPLSVYEQQPEVVQALGDNAYFIDFGQEITGQFQLRAAGKHGQTIEILCGEELTDDGRVRYDMRCNCKYKDTWTLAGGTNETLELFDYKAFRYVEIIAEPGVIVDQSSMAAIVRHYPFDEAACSFESSSELLDNIWNICKNGVKYGSQENYVDCPSREKGQYLGDNTIITHAHTYLSGDLRLFRKSLMDFALLSSRVCPGMMAVAPGHLMQEIADYSLQWPMQLLRYYWHSGDRDFLEDMLPVAERIISHFQKYERQDGLLANVADKWNLVDWPKNLRDGYDFEVDRPAEGCHNVINAFYYGAMKAVAEIRSILYGEDSSHLEYFKEAYRHAFYQPATGLFADAEGSEHCSLHANALPLLFRLVPEEEQRPVIELIRAKGLSCGVYMAYFVLKALAEAGEFELIYQLIHSEELHSWGTMVKEGATACFEAWSKDLKWNTSLCHPWASAPIPVLIEDIIGIKPAEPGWKKVKFSPQLPESLSALKLSFRTPAGVIDFAYENGHSSLSLPAGMTL